MLTTQESINVINSLIKQFTRLEQPTTVEGLEAAKEVLEKQIPVKCEVINQVWGTFHEEIWRCPKCHKDAVRSGFYCYNCGQRLDWSYEK